MSEQARPITPDRVRHYIEHTALNPDTTKERILGLCQEARDHGFKAACVAPVWVATAAQALDGSGVRVVSVVGFPHGDNLSAVKAYEAKEAIAAGVQELDMVMAIGLLKSRQPGAVIDDIRGVVETARPRGVIVKVILETGLLSEQEIVTACEAARRADADFVKTSTGFGPGGATIEAVRLMRRAVGDELGVKAAGGIRTLSAALAMIRAGASRLGCSSSVSIMREVG
ncbi:MAG: deoxyribose-phosphate aldolase [Alphaproteobacteria bacterium]